MRNKWAVLAIACTATLLLSIDLTVLHLALPRLVGDLGATSTQLLWIGDIYGFALAGLLITMGNVGDRIGRKKLLLLGTVAFGVASVVTAYAPNPELLIAARALLGVAGATIMPSTLSIVRDVFTEPGERTMAVGIWSGMAAGGFALGPVIGGVLLDHFWWGSVFLVNVPVTAVLVVAGALILPESRNPRPGRIDLLSVLLSVTGVVGVIYAIKELADRGLGHFPGQVAAVVGVVALVLFCLRQVRLAEPLIELRLFRRRAFSASIATNLLAIFAMMAMNLVSVWYFQMVLGWSPLQAGLGSLPGALAAAGGGALAPVLIARLGRNGLVAAGLLLAAASFAYYYTLGLELNYLLLVGPMMLGGIGIGFIFTVNNDNVLATAPRERAGAAAAISETSFELGGALGIAVLGTVLNTAYTSAMTGPEAARESLAGAIEVAATLPAEQAGPLLTMARQAFVDGMHVTALVTAAILAGVALLAYFGLRGVPKVIPEELLSH
ncbi:MFS transporter [Nonomuraea sp. NPDC050310]|uniref:MFS transporter n=1 Tax=unclassified Nonomuraea TaxID=2593643 RepID=UPI0033C1DA3A